MNPTVGPKPDGTRNKKLRRDGESHNLSEQEREECQTGIMSDGHYHDTVDRGDGVRKEGDQDWCLVNWS